MAHVSDQLGESPSAHYAMYAAAFRHPVDGHGYFSSAEYLEAFDPAVSKQATSIHEANHAEVDTSALFEELVRFYEHFGLRRSQEAELPDHLSVELEFMHYLSELEVHALERGDDVASVRRAEKDFLARHVIRLLHGLIKALSGHEGKALELVQSCLDFVMVHQMELESAM